MARITVNILSAGLKDMWLLRMIIEAGLVLGKRYRLLSRIAIGEWVKFGEPEILISNIIVAIKNFA